MPDGINVSSVLNDQKLTLQFNNVLSFDLADAKVAAPPNVASINQRADVDMSAVDIMLIGEVDVHSFREEKNYIVDVAFQQAEKPAVAEAASRAARRQASIAQQAAAPVKPMARRQRRMAAGQGGDAAATARADRGGDVGGDCRAGQHRNQPGPADDEMPRRRPKGRARDGAGRTRGRKRRQPLRRQQRILRSTAAPAARGDVQPAEAPKPTRAEAMQAVAREAPKAIKTARSRSRNVSSEEELEPRSDKSRYRRCAARQRRPARDIFLCHADAGGDVSPRRHRVAGVRQDRIDRYRTDPRQGWRHHRRRQPVAAGEGPGDPHSPQPAADAFAGKRRAATAASTGR